MKRIKNFFNNRPVFKRILVTLGFITLFRLGASITVPGVSVMATIEESGSFYGVFNMISGGGLAAFSLFALGVTPYITASIIIQLLSSDVIPPLTRLKKQGEKGRIKMEKITRLLAIGLAIMMGMALTISFEQLGMIEFGTMFASYWGNILGITTILVAGSVITIWIADKITMKGIGQGTSVIIFTGIVAGLPSKFAGTYDFLISGATGHDLLIGVSQFLLFIALTAILVMALSYFEISTRKIPIQQTGSGLKLEDNDEQNYLPIKTNPAGVVPVIFASSIITLIPMIVQFFPEDNAARYWITENFALNQPLGFTLFSLLTILFTYFYAHININPEETAENFQKSSTFILGVKPGEDTERYLSKTVTSMATLGAVVLTTVAVMPYALEMMGVPTAFSIGGTEMLIVISVAIDIWEQIKARSKSAKTKREQMEAVKTKVDKYDYSAKGVFT